MVYDDDATVALEKLRTELEARGFAAQLETNAGRGQSLAVRNPRAPMLSETVTADAGWFWWPWADRISPVADVVAAADRVARVPQSHTATRKSS
jgi:hypothetical protein